MSLLRITQTADQNGLSSDEVRVKLEYVRMEGQVYPVRMAVMDRTAAERRVRPIRP